MGLSADLLSLLAALAPPPETADDPEAPLGRLDPRLRTTYSPRTSWHDWHGFGEAPEDRRPAWARCWEAEAAPDFLGSSLAPNSERPPRYGLAGITGQGRRSVWQSLALLEEDRPLLAFWTVTLSTAALAQMNQNDSLPLFQDRLRRELSRALTAEGVEPRVIGVAELQPQRTTQLGMPCPHYHIVFVGRKSRYHPWLLSRERLDQIVASALMSAEVFGIPDETLFLGNVQAIKKSVKAYMAKYMTKGQSSTEAHVGGPAENLLPRQWWFWTAPLRRWVLQHVGRLHPRFLIWVHCNRSELQNLGYLRWRVVPLADERAPLTLELAWTSTESMAVLVAEWLEQEADAEWRRGVRAEMAADAVARGEGLSWQPPAWLAG